MTRRLAAIAATARCGWQNGISTGAARAGGRAGGGSSSHRWSLSSVAQRPFWWVKQMPGLAVVLGGALGVPGAGGALVLEADGIRVGLAVGARAALGAGAGGVKADREGAVLGCAGGAAAALAARHAGAGGAEGAVGGLAVGVGHALDARIGGVCRRAGSCPVVQRGSRCSSGTRRRYLRVSTSSCPPWPCSAGPPCRRRTSSPGSARPGQSPSTAQLFWASGVRSGGAGRPGDGPGLRAAVGFAAGGPAGAARAARAPVEGALPPRADRRDPGRGVACSGATHLCVVPVTQEPLGAALRVPRTCWGRRGSRRSARVAGSPIQHAVAVDQRSSSREDGLPRRVRRWLGHERANHDAIRSPGQ